MSVCQTADPTKGAGEGNILGSVANPYLKASIGDGKLILKVTLFTK